MTRPLHAHVFERLLTCEMRTGSLYAFAEHYDIDYAGYRAEVPFYCSVVERMPVGTRYLEVGAGTGRLVLPLASAGTPCHAVEPARAMRERLLEKLAGETFPPGLVTVEDASAHDFMGPREGTIGVVAFPFNGVQHLHGHAALDAFLAHARLALVDEGLVAFDVTGPAWEEMSAGVREWGRLDERVHAKTGERLFTVDRSVFDDARRVMTTSFRYLGENDDIGVEAFIEQFMWTPQELLHALARHGFTVELAVGDVDFAPLEERSPRLLVAGRKRTG